jgi:hypothetical protein
MLAGRQGLESKANSTGFIIPPGDPRWRTGHSGTGEFDFDFQSLMIANGVINLDLDATLTQIVRMAIKSTPVFGRGGDASEAGLQSVAGEASLFHDRAGHTKDLHMFYRFIWTRI